MGISRPFAAALCAGAAAAVCTPAWPREAATPSACQAAATQPFIMQPKAAADRDPADLRARFRLADAWSDAGCFNDALQVLQNAKSVQPGNKELETRLRVAKSLVGEEHFFDNLDRADTAARLKRDTFRCSTLADLDACGEAVRLKPDDPALWLAQGDALMHAKRPADALGPYRRALALAPNQAEAAGKLAAAETQSAAASSASAAPAGDPNLPPRRTTAAARTTASAARIASTGPGAGSVPLRRYSNAAPESQSH